MPIHPYIMTNTLCSSCNQLRPINSRLFCNSCIPDIFPFSNIDNEEFNDNFSIYSQPGQPKPCKTTKCNHCMKRVNQNVSFVYCTNCSKFYHLDCSNVKKKDFPLPNEWHCNKCSLNCLPFSGITDDNLLLNLQGLTTENADSLSNLPSFTIQSLLDQLPGQNFSTDDFLSDSIESKYYTPAQFIAEKFSKKYFTMIHLNIASLQRHIDELRTFLSILDHPFQIICISETRLHDDQPLSNIEIDGYEFIHTKTTSQCGGVGIYIKSGIEYEIINNLSLCHHNISESIFIEIKNEKKKNIVLGCIYRHHTPVSDFSNVFFDQMLEKISKKKKTCFLLGDFNVDLIKYGDNTSNDLFYDQISSYGFRPLILQPTRVHSNSATLIDNIFTNDVECFSKGGNIATSISDHFIQISQIDIFERTNNNKKIDKYS